MTIVTVMGIEVYCETRPIRKISRESRMYKDNNKMRDIFFIMERNQLCSYRSGFVFLFHYRLTAIGACLLNIP